MNIKNILKLVATACVVGGAEAAYHPQVKAQESRAASVVEGVAACRELPKLVREAYFAEKLGLLFLQDGTDAYTLAPHKHLRAEQVKLDTPRIHEAALFVGSDGEQHEYTPLIHREVLGQPAQQAATKALEALYREREEPILAAFADEVSGICLNTARDRMDSLQPLAREALLAELGGWVYKQGSAYSSATVRRYPTGLYSCGRSVMRINRHARGQWFIDSHGRKQDFHLVVRDAEEQKGNAHSWKLVLLIAQYIGAEDILALYPEESAAMRRNYTELRAAK